MLSQVLCMLWLWFWVHMCSCLVESRRHWFFFFSQSSTTFDSSIFCADAFVRRSCGMDHEQHQHSWYYIVRSYKRQIYQWLMISFKLFILCQNIIISYYGLNFVYSKSYTEVLTHVLSNVIISYNRAFSSIIGLIKPVGSDFGNIWMVSLYIGVRSTW